MITRSSNLATNQLIELVRRSKCYADCPRVRRGAHSVLRGVEDQKAFDKGLINTTTSADLATLLAAIERGNASVEGKLR